MNADRCAGRRPGFTLIEVLIALAITAVIGAAVTSVFITQTRFYNRQEQVAAARGVSRGAMNILTSELRMIERVNGVVAASADSIVLRVPYVFGLSCGPAALGTRLALRYLPTDTVVLRRDTVFSGHAWSAANGAYTYINNNIGLPVLDDGGAVCDAAGVAAIPGGGTLTVPMVAPGNAGVGRPVFLYQTVTYRFANSAQVPGRRALWRRTHRNNRNEELVAPFAPTARFRFFINDAATAVDNPPAADDLDELTGIRITMDGLSEWRSADGTHEHVPLATSVFFRNRLD